MKTMKWCLGIATLCIALLTGLAGYLLISNFDTIDSKVSIKTEQCKCSDNSANKTTASNNQSENLTQKGVSSDNDLSSTDDHQGLLDSIVYNVTLAVNAVNNVLTSGSIFIAILTLFIGLVGLFGFYTLKSDLKDKILEFDGRLTKNETRIDAIEKLINKCCTETKDKINEVDKKLVEFEQRIDTKIGNEIEEIEERNEVLNVRLKNFHNSLTQQEEYINQTINYLFQATYANINQMSEKEQAREILSRIHHDMQIARLYRTSLNTENNDTYDREKFAVFAYLEMNGTMEDIPHLEYVVEHDPNVSNRRRAIEVIAVIRSRG